jgi:hypothetical protein
MKLAQPVAIALLSSSLLAATALASPVREEHVTGGALDLVWQNGFGVSAGMKPVTLAPSDPGYANISGDHTVACATSMPVDSGGIVLAATEPAGLDDYAWEGWIFTGDGNTRRGLVLRADPTNGFASCYQFVIESGLFQIRFRRLVNSSPTGLMIWFTTALPGGTPTTNSWHHMRVIALGNAFRCFWDGFELTSSPIIDSTLPTGWVGVYNFRPDIGGVPFLTDDLLLTPAGETAAQHMSWGALKQRYAK